MNNDKKSIQKSATIIIVLLIIIIPFSLNLSTELFSKVSVIATTLAAIFTGFAAYGSLIAASAAEKSVNSWKKQTTFEKCVENAIESKVAAMKLLQVLKKTRGSNWKKAAETLGDPEKFNDWVLNDGETLHPNEMKNLHWSKQTALELLEALNSEGETALHNFELTMYMASTCTELEDHKIKEILGKLSTAKRHSLQLKELLSEYINGKAGNPLCEASSKLFGYRLDGKKEINECYFIKNTAIALTTFVEIIDESVLNDNKKFFAFN